VEESVVFEVSREGWIEPLGSIKFFSVSNLNLIAGGFELRVVGKGDFECLLQVELCR
jgi:hypothetical protein